MNKLISSLNNSYGAKHKYLYLTYKVKYLDLLLFLEKRSLIYSFTILNMKIFCKNKKVFYVKKMIKIYLNYYKNKPMFYIEQLSKASINFYYNEKQLRKSYKFIYANYTILTNNIYGFIEKETAFIYKVGGHLLIKIRFLDKNLDG